MMGRGWHVACAALLLVAVAVQAAPATSASVTGVVTHVTDGDSLWLRPDRGGSPIEVRLVGIDAPEICQEHGDESKAFLSQLVLNRPARLATTGRDSYGRTLGRVHVEGVEINRRLVEEGQAWSVRTRWDQGPYVSQERMARALSRGLHQAGSAAVMPRDFRARHGPCHAGAPAPPRPATATRPAPAPTPAPATVPTATRRCDGRTRCSQMTSCDEAIWFLRNCPGVQMDGNRDGVPCEQQWCRR